MIRVVDANVTHLLEMASAPVLRLTLTSTLYRLLAAQIALSDAFAVYAETDARAPIAIGGLAALPKNETEVWLVVRPGGIGRDLLSCVRFAQRALAERPGDPICFVRRGNQDGERLARMLGLTAGPWLGDCRQWRRA